MQPEGTGVLDHSTDHPANLERRLAVQRGWLALVLLSIFLLLALVPPLVSLGRYQHRIATSMSQVLGRPVHLDRVTLNLLPLPSFTIENLVIDEVPAFGAEPLIRANSVHARLRVASLWRHRVEFSRITFTDPASISPSTPTDAGISKTFCFRPRTLKRHPPPRPAPATLPVSLTSRLPADESI